MPVVSSPAVSVAAALVAVATSPVMPGWRSYCASVRADPRPARPPETAARLAAVLSARAVPTTEVAHVVASLVSFTDDHASPVQAAMFPASAGDLLDDLARISRSDRVLDRREQLALASRHAGCAFEALAISHAVTRLLARGRDVRGLGIALSLDERLRIGRVIAAFPEALSRGGDPLGDTYHYWANVIAGVTAAHVRGATGRAIARVFHAGPVLMRLVRQGAFGRRLFHGDHAAIDRLGLATGLQLDAAQPGTASFTKASKSSVSWSRDGACRYIMWPAG